MSMHVKIFENLKTYVIFGGGANLKKAIYGIYGHDKNAKIKYIVDTNNFGYSYELDGMEFKVFSPVRLYEDRGKCRIVISSTDHYFEMAGILDQMGFVEGKDYFGISNITWINWKQDGEKLIGLSTRMDLRVHIMSDMLLSENGIESVLDVGCGNGLLKGLLPSKIKYYGCDYIKRDNSTIVCDLEKDFPEVETDVIFASGVLEHIKNYPLIIKNMCLRTKYEILVSYTPIEYESDIIQRRMKHWQNNLSVEEFSEEFYKNGFAVKKTIRLIAAGGAVYQLKRI